MNGTVFIGHLVVGEDGEEVEVFEAVACCRCFNEAYNRRGPGLNEGALAQGWGKKLLIWGRRHPHRRCYSGHYCKSVAGSRAPLRLFGGGKIVKTVRLNHLRATLLAVAVAGLLAAVGVFVVVLYAQPAEANFPGKPGKIAFAGEDGTDLVIYTIKPDGGGKRPLIANGTNRYPAYSPNGKQIAFAGYDGNDYEIYTIKAGGGGKKQLTDNSTNDYDPAYSPSGKRIAFDGKEGNHLEIYTIKVGGGGKLQVTDNSSDDYYPDYAPNGKRIVFTNNAGPDKVIYTIQINGGNRLQVTDNSSNDIYPSYSPSGKKIAYENYVTGSDGEIWTIQPNGGGRQQVTDNANNDRDPYWGSQ
jgi:hypothetical protein